MSAKPALLDGQPAFKNDVPIVRPLLPSGDDMVLGVQGMLASGRLTNGMHLHRFEAAIAEYLGVPHAVAVSSCTAGLMLTYRSFGLSGEVVVPSFTFMATVSAMIWANLRPVFVDVNPRTANMDPAVVEAAITPQTSAIVAVHNFGNPADIDALQAIAERYRLKLIFDAAHAFGASYRGEPVGGQADAQVFSLSPTKLLIAGEGGIVATHDDALAETLRIGREYGNAGNYDSAFAGINARMSEFHALLGLQSLGQLEAAVTRRHEVAAQYRHWLGQVPGIGFQHIRPEDRSSYKDFSITVDAGAFGMSRDDLATALAAEHIDTRKYYDPPVHCQTAYHPFAPSWALPHTTYLAAHSLSLPLWSNMDDAIVRGICQAIQRIHAYAADVALALREQRHSSAA